MRPVRNHSQTVALVNQLLHRNTLQADSIPLDKSEHFTHGFALCTICSIRAPRSVFFAENLQNFLDAVKVARLRWSFVGESVYERASHSDDRRYPRFPLPQA